MQRLKTLERPLLQLPSGKLRDLVSPRPLVYKRLLVHTQLFLKF